MVGQVRRCSHSPSTQLRRRGTRRVALPQSFLQVLGDAPHRYHLSASGPLSQPRMPPSRTLPPSRCGQPSQQHHRVPSWPDRRTRPARRTDPQPSCGQLGRWAPPSTRQHRTHARRQPHPSPPEGRSQDRQSRSVAWAQLICRARPDRSAKFHSGLPVRRPAHPKA